MTLRCDASQSGLGAAMMQGGQSVAYASRALTPYTQIEKELLAIMFASQRFVAYIYWGECLNVETDHKPLEIIVRKPLNTAPNRLQRMMIALQKFDLNVYYKRGETVFLADTLSRAYLLEMNSCEVAQECETVDHRSSLPVTDDSNFSLHLEMTQC